MYQAAMGFLIAETGDAPYRVSEVIAAFTSHLSRHYPRQSGYGEDILYGYSLRTITVYDVVYRASPKEASGVRERALAFVAFCADRIDERAAELA